MLKNAYLLAKIGADTAENERNFAEILPIGRRVADLAGRLLLICREEAIFPARRAVPVTRGSQPSGGPQLAGRASF